MSQKKANKKPQSYNRFEKHQQRHSLYSHFVWGNELTHLVKISPCSGVNLPLVSKSKYQISISISIIFNI